MFESTHNKEQTLGLARPFKGSSGGHIAIIKNQDTVDLCRERLMFEA
jgi:hypothetical protein